jgi:hypothetical protein
MVPQLPPEKYRDVVGIGSILCVTFIFAVFRGIAGVIAGIVLLIFWYALTPIHAFAFGQVALAGFFSHTVSSLQFIFIELCLLCLLLDSAFDFDRWLSHAALTSGCFFALGLFVWGYYRFSGDLLVTFLLLSGVVALLAYGLHRYDKIKLDGGGIHE